MITIEEAAKLMRVSPDTIRRRIKKNEIEATKLPGPYGEQWFIPVDKLEGVQDINEMQEANQHLTTQDISNLIEMLVEKRTESMHQELISLQKKVREMQQQLLDLQEQNKKIEAQLRLHMVSRDYSHFWRKK